VHHKDAWSLKLSTSGLSRSTLPIRAGLDTLPPVCRSSTRRLLTRLIFQLWKLVPIDGRLAEEVAETGPFTRPDEWLSSQSQPATNDQVFAQIADRLDHHVRIVRQGRRVLVNPAGP
jgi:hypothetical protein